MVSKRLCTLAFAAAAAASIASSQPADTWLVDEEAALPTLYLDAQQPRAVLAIHVDVDGPGPYPDLSGYLWTRMGMQPRPDGSTAEVRATLRSTTNPDEQVTLTETLPVEGYLAAFTSCMAAPCSEDFELVVELVDIPATGSVQINGSVEVDARGTGAELASSTTLVIDVARVP